MNNSRASHYRYLLLHSPLLILLFGLWIQLSALYDREHQIHNIAVQAAASSTDTDKQGTKTETTTASANYNSSNGNYIAVTNQTSITSDGKVNIDTKGNTHLRGALIEGETATSITTATLTTEDIHNRADYNAMSVGASYTHSTSPDQAKDNGISPNIGLPQDVDKSSTTHTAIAENTVINITDPDNQTQDTSKISRDTEHASYTMTQINTEVLDIRAGISQDLSKDGFKAVGDLAMAEGWEDGSVEKTLAHAAMGAVVAGIGNGDALGGALGAGAAEAARPATADANDATQQSVSALVGAIAGGGTGASVGLDGEKYNRQLHQREIAWLKDKANIQAFMEYYQITMGKTLSFEDAARILAQGGAALVDKSWNDRLGNNADVKEAQDFIKDTYTDKSAIFYDDPNSPVKYGTHAFNPDAEEYKDRYANLRGFTDNKDFYRDNLNLGTGKGASAGDYVSGAVQPIKDLGNALYNDPLGTLQATGEAIIHPIDSGQAAGAHIAELEDKAQLDSMMGDDQSAAQHRGEAYGGIAGAVITKGAIKGITKIGGGKVRVTLENGKKVEVPEGAVYDNKGIYDPKAVKAYLEEKHGAENVSSTTIPTDPKTASTSRGDVIIDRNGNKAVKVTDEHGNTKYIPYDSRELPIFDDVSQYTTGIQKPANWENMSEKARRSAEMRAATRQLREDIESGKVDAGQFTEEQLKYIQKGSDKIPDYTWHHNAQSSPNNMQLIPEDIHKIPHSGEGSMSR